MATAIGLDIGSSSVKAAVLKASGRTVTLQRFCAVSFEELNERGVDPADPGSLASGIARWLEEQQLPRTGLQLGVAGRDSIIRFSNLPPMPPWRLKLIMEYEIGEVADKAGEALTADYSIVPAQTTEGGFCVLVALAKDASIEPRMEALGNRNIDVASGQPVAVAIGDALRFLGDPAESGYTVVADIGETSTDVAVLDDGVLVFARTLTTGGEAFTKAIAKRFDLDFEEAEACKLEREGPDGENLGAALKMTMSQLSTMLSSTLSYMSSQLKLAGPVKPAKLVLTGGGARLPGLAMVLGGALGCPAEVWDPLAGIETSGAPASDAQAIEAAGMASAAACGLALKPLMESATKLDLLPKALRARRDWLHRTRWLWAAAAVVLLQGLVSLGLSYHRYSLEAGRAATLQKVNSAKVNTRLVGHKKRQEANAQREAVLGAIASRAKAGRHLQQCLELVARILPRNMTLESFTLEPAKSPTGRNQGLQPAAAMTLVVKGRIDNAQLRCEQQLAQLEEDLRLDPSVESARIVPTSDTQEPRVSFEMTVQPKDPES